MHSHLPNKVCSGEIRTWWSDWQRFSCSPPWRRCVCVLSIWDPSKIYSIQFFFKTSGIITVFQTNVLNSNRRHGPEGDCKSIEKDLHRLGFRGWEDLEHCWELKEHPKPQRSKKMERFLLSAAEGNAAHYPVALQRNDPVAARKTGGHQSCSHFLDQKPMCCQQKALDSSTGSNVADTGLTT